MLMSRRQGERWQEPIAIELWGGFDVGGFGTIMGQQRQLLLRSGQDSPTTMP